MNWFERLTGFPEEGYDPTRQRLHVAEGRLHSKVNGQSWLIGQLSTPSLAELRQRSAQARGEMAGALKVRNVVEDAYELHVRSAANGAVVQVASQFNLLEMVHPDISPDDGVAGYEHDHTQGPACARAAGAGTIYRNYFAPVGDHRGQTEARQINTFAELCAALPGSEGVRMRNGYALIDQASLEQIAAHLRQVSEAERDELRGLLRIGLHEDVAVTVPEAQPDQALTQAYCSALPVSYNRTGHMAHLWEPLARLVLEAAYEATLHAALINAARTGNPRVYLTFLGGGAFGNDRGWILGAIRRALACMQGVALQVNLVSYGQPAADLADMLTLP